MKPFFNVRHGLGLATLVLLVSTATASAHGGDLPAALSLLSGYLSGLIFAFMYTFSRDMEIAARIGIFFVACCSVIGVVLGLDLVLPNPEPGNVVHLGILFGAGLVAPTLTSAVMFALFRPKKKKD